MFDVDGVLLDSLPQHLQICKDKGEKDGLSIPTAEEFREKVRQGTKISPMKYFFLAVGFLENDAARADEEYKANFNKDYHPEPFPHIYKMLDKLKSEGLRMGIATSNVRSNLDAVLDSETEFFHQDCIFTKEDDRSLSKTDALLLAAKKLNVDITEILYVGDQPSDWTAAKEAHANFLGVTYGWGISQADKKKFPVVDDVMSIADYILNDRTFVSGTNSDGSEDYHNHKT